MFHLWVFLEQRQQHVAWHFCHAATVDGCYRHSLSITKQVETTREVVATLSIGDDTFIAFVLSRSCFRLSCDFDEPLQQNMRRFARRAAFIVLGEKTLIAFILLDR